MQKSELKTLPNRMKGSVSSMVMGIGVSIVMLFVVLFMIVQVATVTAINSSSDFYDTYSNLITSTGTIYLVLVLALILVSLSIGIGYLVVMAKSTDSGGSSI